MKDVLKLLSTTAGAVALIAGGTYFAIREQWLWAAIAGVIMIAAYLYYTISLDESWTVFRLHNPNEPDHPELPGQGTIHSTGAQDGGLEDQHRG